MSVGGMAGGDRKMGPRIREDKKGGALNAPASTPVG